MYYYDQDRRVNEIVQPRKWTALCSVRYIYNEIWTQITPFFISMA